MEKFEPYKVSILVPIYNVERFIGRCVQSLFNQTYKNLEFIFIDDCSTDNSLKVLDREILLNQQRSSQCKIVKHDKNRGLKGSRNTGVANASGLFIVHVDSDDSVDSHFVELLVKRQQEGDFDIVSCDYYICSKGKRELVSKIDHNSTLDMVVSILRRENEPTSWGRLIRLSIFRDNNIVYDEVSKMSEDLGTTPIIFYYARSCSTLHMPLVFYNKDNENAATAHFNEKKLKADTSCLNLYDFFQDKDLIYLHALDLGCAKMVIQSLIMFSQLNNQRPIYEYFREQANNIHNSVIADLDTKYKIVLLLARYKFLLRVYSVSGLFLKSIMRTLKEIAYRCC